FYFAAYLGLHDLLLPLVESLDEKDYLKTGEESNDPYNLRQEIVFGLRDPKLVDFHMRRLKIKIRIEDMFRRPIDIYLKAWLAHTEYSALDYITESILTSTNKEKTEKLINIFALVNLSVSLYYSD
ncbi:MAG TPA: hypothetical protein PKX55_25945, partial [Leptospiraceae bacterium]|nr:hypothetical protein [Leptospiraceae bacterium]